MDDTFINAATLIIVTGITTIGTVIVARTSKRFDNIEQRQHSTLEAVHTANGDTLGQIVENISEKQDLVKQALEATRPSAAAGTQKT